MEESLKSSNGSIDRSSQKILNSLEDKMLDPTTNYKAVFWLPKAQQIAKFSKESYDYLEGLKQQQELSAEETEELLNKLKEYKTNIQKIDPSIKDAFSIRSISFFIIDSLNNNSGAFYEKYINSSNKLSKAALLTKLQNSIKLFENRVLEFCHNKSAVSRHICTFEVPLVSQNAEIIKQGNLLEIMAAIGSFSYREKPEITINGKIIPLNDMGCSLYKRKINNPPGKYSIPVKIIYTDQNGNKLKAEKIIEYTVIKECDQ